ncbi:conserved exported hypothetical protein [Candidatus Sulfopaludibacter sp. SbA3]|nr:conserved exported hypothetical protein [Candidatus Sulfopaludibacter sp. SbA3]
MHKRLLAVVTIWLGVVFPGFAGGCGAENPDFNGKWVYAGDGGGPARQIRMELKSDGAILTGTVSDTMGLNGGGGEIMNGRVAGISISFETKVGMNGGTRVTNYEGWVCRDALMLKISQGRNIREVTARRFKLR